MANMRLTKGQQAQLKNGLPVQASEQAGSRQIVIDDSQINTTAWATLDAGGTIMVLAFVVGTNKMEETFVTAI